MLLLEIIVKQKMKERPFAFIEKGSFGEAGLEALSHKSKQRFLC